MGSEQETRKREIIHSGSGLSDVQAVSWVKEGDESGLCGGRLRLLDQTRLPNQEVYLELTEARAVFEAIQRLSVRGAPAIGCAAALGLAAASGHSKAKNTADFMIEVEQTADYLASARPTAVNLSWSLQRCLKVLRRAAADGEERIEKLHCLLIDEALAIVEEDKRMCQAIGEHGLALFNGRVGVSLLTHCNAGALATAGAGTALAPVYAASQAGLAPLVYADETRPLLQGARLTVWELQRAGVEVTLICDNMAAQLMQAGSIDFVIVGADRIAANGDTANKIGTYGLAVLAAYHRIPFYVAAPYSTIDLNVGTGREIPIEQRSADEVVRGFGSATAPPNCRVYNPAFDVTPAALISGIVTEQGILRPPYSQRIAELGRP